MAHDIFISHSSKDKTIADAACACLESRGLRCWIAPRDIVAGADWSESIIDGISGAKAMVLILSSHSNVSKQVLREIERAANRGIPVLPFRVEDVVLSKSLEYFLSSAHWLDAYHGPLKHNLEKLANNAAVVVEKQDAVRPLADPVPRSSWHGPALLTAAAVGTLLAIVAGAISWRARAVAPVEKLAAGPGTAEGPVAGATGVVRFGIEGENLLPPVAKNLGALNGGVGVTRVSERQNCGIRPGDVIVKFRDQPIANVEDLINAGWRDLSLDQEYPVTVIREGEPLQLSVCPIRLETQEPKPNDLVRFGEVRRFDPRNGLTWLSRLATTRDAIVVVDVDKKAFAWKDGADDDSPFEIPGRTFSAVAAGEDGPAWLIDAVSGDLVSWDPSSQRVGDVIEGVQDEEVVDLLVTRDGHTAVAVDASGTVHTWSLRERGGAKRFSLEEPAAAHGVSWLGLHAGDFSLTANGRHLGQWTARMYVVWDLEQGEVSRVISSDKRLTAGALSPDGRLAAIANENGLVEVWDITDQKRVASLRWHTDEVSQLLFLSPGYLVSLAKTPRDGSALVWDLRDQSVAWGYVDDETNGVFAFGPKLVSFNREAGSLFLGVMNVREMSLPEAIADELRDYRWEEDTLTLIAKPSQQAATRSSMTLSFGDGKSREISDLADGSKMITERNASGDVSAMVFQPGESSCGLGIRLGVSQEGSADAVTSIKVGVGVTVEDVVAGGQAARDGVIRNGDVITAVIERDGAEPTALTGLFLAEVTSLLRGPEGSSLGLLVLRDGATEPIVIKATRGKVLPVKNRPAKSDFTNSLGMHFIAVPGGIGSLGIEQHSDATMAPHYVRITKGFLIGAHEVTQDEFVAVMSSRPSSFSQGGQRAEDVAKAYDQGAIPNADTVHHPVDSVSWEDANEFCRRLSDREGHKYRLPTEAEWEWACRNAGQRWWRGEFEPAGDGLDEETVGRHLDFPVTPHPVGSRSPNDGGVHDMLGNVAEWCADIFADDGFASAAFVDPQGPPEGLKRVVRGGSFKDNQSDFFKRASLLPTDKRPYVGFRVVLEPAVGMLADKSLEDVILDTARWEIDESAIPDPIPAIPGSLRTSQEEEQEAVAIEQAITAGTALRELRDTLMASAYRNQSQFDIIKHMYPELCARIGDRSVPAAYADYRAAQRGRLLVLYDQARAKDPLLGWACNDLAWGLATNPDEKHRDPAVAVARAVEACEMAKWQYWGFLDTLAAALASAGRHESAVRVAKAALERAPRSERPQIEYAIDRYAKGLAWAGQKP